MISESKPKGVAVRLDWYCPGGHNSFESAEYLDDDPPECGSCGAVMTTDSSSYDEVHESIEKLGAVAYADSHLTCNIQWNTKAEWVSSYQYTGVSRPQIFT